MEKTSTYLTLINEEWRVEKSKNSINVEGGFLFCGGWNFSKSVSVGPTFIREMRVIRQKKFTLSKLGNAQDLMMTLKGRVSPKYSNTSPHSLLTYFPS